MAGADKLTTFLGMLESGQDGPLLRYSIGLEYLDRDQPDEAASHLTRCLELDPGYSAAYKALAQAQDSSGQPQACRATLETGIARADEKGDRQAKKEMEVFLRRLEKGRPLKPAQ